MLNLLYFNLTIILDTSCSMQWFEGTYFKDIIFDIDSIIVIVIVTAWECQWSYTNWTRIMVWWSADVFSQIKNMYLPTI